MKISHFAARHTFKDVGLSSVILFLSGCASVPQSIRGEPGAIRPASFEKISQAPYQFLRLNVGGYQVWQQEENFTPFDGMSFAWSPEWGYPLPGDGLKGVYPVTDGSYLVR